MSPRNQGTRRVLAEHAYGTLPVERGYTGQTLYVNLSDNTIAAKPVTDVMKEKFIGGRGFGLWLLWHGVKDDTRWDDPENEIVISSTEPHSCSRDDFDNRREQSLKSLPDRWHLYSTALAKA